MLFLNFHIISILGYITGSAFALHCVKAEEKFGLKSQ